MIHPSEGSRRSKPSGLVSATARSPSAGSAANVRSSGSSSSARVQRAAVSTAAQRAAGVGSAAFPHVVSVSEAGIGEPGAYVRLTVRDTGTGMDATTLGRAFEPFFTTRKQNGGTGLGLSIVQGIVRQGGGEIRMDSEPGDGTRVSILLPRQTGDVESLADTRVARAALTSWVEAGRPIPADLRSNPGIRDAVALGRRLSHRSVSD